MPQTTQIERVGADTNYSDFAPSFGELLATGESELIREPLR